MHGQQNDMAVLLCTGLTGGDRLLVFYWVVAGLALASLGLYLAGMIGFGWPVGLVLLFVVMHLTHNARRNRG